jgi:hypothetical protein
MGKTSNEDRDANALKLVAIWLSWLGGASEKDFMQKDFGWLYYSEIVNEADSFNKRTLSRYLNWLVNEGILEVQKDGPRTRRFRPTWQYWKKNFKWLRNDNVLKKEELEAADAEYLYFIELASNISDKFEYGRLFAGIQQTAKDNNGTEMSRAKLNELNSKIANLVRTVRLDLSREYLQEDREPESVYSQLRGNVKRLVNAYTDLWLFLIETKGAREEFSKQMLSVQRRVAKLKREH